MPQDNSSPKTATDKERSHGNAISRGLFTDSSLHLRRFSLSHSLNVFECVKVEYGEAFMTKSGRCEHR